MRTTLGNALRASIASLTLLAASASHGELPRALRLVPPDAAGFVAVPSLKRASDDLSQLIERMDRPGTALLGRPIDQLKATLGISAAVEDRGPLVAFMPAAAAGEIASPRILVPTLDPAGFLEANFTKAPESGESAYRDSEGRLWHARPIDGFVLLCGDAAAVAAYDPGEGILEAWRSRVGEAWFAALERADLVAWGGPQAIADLFAQSRRFEAEAMPAGVAFDREAAERWSRAIEASLEDGIVAVEFDPLGVAIRSYARLRPGSPLGSLTDRTDPAKAAAFDRLPRQAFYAAAAMNLAGLGGAEPLREAAALAGVDAEAWLGVAELLQSAQFAAYPSRLGLAAGGFLNDSALVLEVADATALRERVAAEVVAASGESGGLRRSGSFERGRTLRDGRIVDAFAVEQVVIPAGEGGGEAGLQDLATRQLLWQVLFGSRGLNGFLRAEAGESRGVLTFSQRPDVFARALAAADGGGGSLADDGAVRAMRSWLPANAQAVAFIGVGQFGRLLRQLAGIVPGGIENLPEIPTSIEPIGLGLAVAPHRVESAAVLPAGVLGLAFDRIVEAIRERGAAALPPPAAGGGETP